MRGRMAAIYRTIVRISARALEVPRKNCAGVSGQRDGGSVMTEDGTSIRVRIDEEGYTYITVMQWDEDGREIVYREDEHLQCSEPQF